MREPTTLVLGAIEENCYILPCGALVDPGFDFPAIERALGTLQITPSHILLTHGHFDHFGAVHELRERYGCAVVIGENDAELLDDPSKSHGSDTPRFHLRADQTVREGDVLAIGGASIRVLDTPGHTRGGVCYLCDEQLYSGDTLFKGDCGRCDLYGGDYPTILRSLHKLAALPPETKVYPGHGPSTTIGAEAASNAYMKAPSTDHEDLY